MKLETITTKQKCKDTKLYKVKMIKLLNFKGKKLET
jgi:hypothetical protein